MTHGELILVTLSGKPTPVYTWHIQELIDELIEADVDLLNPFDPLIMVIEQ